MPSEASATTSRSGAASSTIRMPRRTTVWSSASRIRIFSGCVLISPGGTGGPRCRAGRTCVTSRSAPTSSARSRIPRTPLPERRPAASMPRAVVAHAQHDRAVLGLQAELGARGAGVADDVDEALLGDAVDDELVLVGSASGGRRRGAATPAGRCARQGQSRATRARSAGRSRRAPPGAAGAAGRAPPRCRRGQTASSERSSARSSSGARASSVSSWSTTPVSVWPISSWSSRAIRRRSSLLRVERAAGAVAALALEPVEHVVEREAELGDLGGLALDLDPLAGSERVDAAHQRGQLLERAEHAPQREQVDGQHRGDADAEQRHLAGVDARAHRRGREREHGDRRHEHGGVDGEDAPEQGHEIMMPRRARPFHGRRSPTGRVDDPRTCGALPEHERADLPRAPGGRRAVGPARPAPRPRRRRARPAVARRRPGPGAPPARGDAARAADAAGLAGLPLVRRAARGLSRPRHLPRGLREARGLPRRAVGAHGRRARSGPCWAASRWAR